MKSAHKAQKIPFNPMLKDVLWNRPRISPIASREKKKKKKKKKKYLKNSEDFLKESL